MEDFARVDAMIAIRLRATGHSQEAETDTTMQCAPTIRANRQAKEGRSKRETRDGHRYAERTTAYAFGVAGDVTLARNDMCFEHWRRSSGLSLRDRQHRVSACGDMPLRG